MDLFCYVGFFKQMNQVSCFQHTWALAKVQIRIIPLYKEASKKIVFCLKAVGLYSGLGYLEDSGRNLQQNMSLGPMAPLL